MFIVNPHTGKDEGEDPGVNPLGKTRGKSTPSNDKPEPFAGRGSVVEPANDPKKNKKGRVA
jgi:hypothetical protein